MSIKPSAAAEIRSLVAALASTDRVTRESAIARLAVIGGRAVDRLLALYANPATPRATRIAILRALEGIGDARALSTARSVLPEGGDLATAAVGALRPLLTNSSADVSAAALDALVATAMDRTAERRVRMAAFDALQDLPQQVRDRIAAALADDPDTTVKARATSKQKDDTTLEAIWRDAVEGDLPDDPDALRDAVQARGATAPLSDLHKLIDAIRTREGEGSVSTRRSEWRAVRGALHQALALRGSRVALYDLRETVEAADATLPPTYMAALQVVGDDSCLQPIAAAFTRSADDERWRRQLTAAFQAIVARERTSRTTAALKRISARWPEASAAFSTTSRTRVRPTTRGRT
jgi:hypothetical protein